MVSTFTPNIQLEEPARGDLVGVWDTPVNNNMSLIDLVAGGITLINLNSSPVVLAAAQYEVATIVFGSTLTASVTITFPSSFKKTYFIRNACTGSSAFTVTLQTTVAGGLAICAPPYDNVQVINDGQSVSFMNLGRIGSYMDYAGSSVPSWISGCTVPPYLNCDGSAFSAATYPQLATILGGTTLPDSKGRARFTLDQAAGRLSSAVAGFSPNAVGNAGGSQNYQQHTHVNTLTDLGHTHSYTTNAPFGASGSGVGINAASAGATTGLNGSVPMSITNVAAGTGTAGNVPPAYIGGLTLIRAA